MPNWWFQIGDRLLAFPQSIAPVSPDFMKCDPRYGQFIDKKECRLAVAQLPKAREGAEVDWAVNHVTQTYSLPLVMDYKGCAVAYEAAGPQAYYEVDRIKPPFIVRASPFQLRGLAAYVVNSCVIRETHDGGDASIGGFATNKIGNLADFVLDESTNLDSDYPTTSTYLTVTVGNKEGKSRSPGNFHPSVAVLVAEYLAHRGRGQKMDQQRRIDSLIRDFNRRTQAMNAGGQSTPFWGAVGASEEEMSYECDATLGAPAEVDCAQVEWSELGADDDTLSIGPGVTRVLSSNTCHLTISAAIATVLRWRQVRVALDTLLNACLANPIQRPTGGRAFVGGRTGISGGLWGRDLSNATYDVWNGNLTGLDALTPGVNLTVSAQPLLG